METFLEMLREFLRDMCGKLLHFSVRKNLLENKNTTLGRLKQKGGSRKN